ncbi:WD40-repeat-containing domain protein [Phakopsora pachyrhizi]|uniref:WD40-repeat-containing domain protein n=1 Tax=Phakopsora pachyrhizi TaxID=170000 RepID=A0AAV0B294_PHAPC|nr:WD40-repeat-containing domain protein [Phakopsora pachyrhizi]CAH7676391.1 WD40-repeat-containing domain protein [Phakopsora pachyrhizi]
MATKRPGEFSALTTKRVRPDEPEGQQLVVSSDGTGKGQLIQTVKRTSGLAAPIMVLSGHSAEVLDVKFDASGDHLASASMDRTINLWSVYGDECRNYGVLHGPKGAITSIEFSPLRPLQRLYAGSADKTLTTFDLKSGESVRRNRSHGAILNSISVSGVSGHELVASASDDGTIRIWREEDKDCIDLFELGYPLTAVEWSSDGQQLFVGGLDNDIHCFDLRNKKVSLSLRSHTDTIAGLKLSPDGSFLLSAGFDDTVRIWDVRPFAPVNNMNGLNYPSRLVQTLLGAPAGFDNQLRKPTWDPTGDKVAVGSADRTLCIWKVSNGNILYKLPGHKGTVTSCEFHPREPIIASGGVDRQVFLGEIDPMAR